LHKDVKLISETPSQAFDKNIVDKAEEVSYDSPPLPMVFD
jgi:hypothetical protein